MLILTALDVALVLKLFSILFRDVIWLGKFGILVVLIILLRDLVKMIFLVLWLVCLVNLMRIIFAYFLVLA